MSVYEVEKIQDNLYSIKEDITNNKFPIIIYLVIGKEKAALIDTGIGSGNLSKVVRSITKKQVIVLHTHGHLDHVGADALFSELYLNCREYYLASNGGDFQALTNERLNFIKLNLKDKTEMYENIKSHIVKSEKTYYNNISDGDTIDLGETKLEAVSTPGHTPGSISYVNNKDHYAFTGDGIADIHWFDGKESIKVEDFLNTLNHFENKAKRVKKIYAAHVPKAFDLELVHDLQTAARAIINGADDEIENADYEFLKHGNLYAHRYGQATIYYDKENI
ncbi:MBL fold metallo-hydrolase [Clostridium guangxiense]|uniref:MBL fold metallo-hydrolase n=1 Tax=Clostridium guangxiense TaxID=1662055 RepID=UPI001E32E2D7|nr:MBL fold metallo-hydrolase [Clostridium guangxiense]MCD2347056.1 MBL fold metallo-hydrolase [Clostridium guangxiense]